MRGDLHQSSLAEVLRHLYAERMSGTLCLSRGNLRRRVHFNKGVAVFADEAESRPILREEATELFHSLFAWTSGEFFFVPGEPTIEKSLAFGSSPSTPILEGSRRIRTMDVLERLVGGRGSVFRCAQTSVLPLFTMKLAPAERDILSFARERERFTAAELPLSSDELSVVSALNALVAVGLLEILQKAPPSVPEPPLPVAPPSPPPPTVAASPSPSPSPVSPDVEDDAILDVPTDIEQLLDRFEAKRAGGVRPTPETSEKPELPPGVELANVAPGPPGSRPKLPPSPAPAPSSAPAPAPEREREHDVPAASPEPTMPFKMPAVVVEPTADAVVSARAPSWKNGAGAWIAQGHRRWWVSGGAVVSLSLAVALSLSLGGNEPPEPNAATASPELSVEPATSPSAVGSTSALAPEPTSVPAPEPEPSEAELFYRANLAFESGDYGQSKQQLTRLLELEPDLAAAHALLARVESALAPKPEPPKPSPPPRQVVAEAPPAPAPAPPPAAPTPAGLFDEARAALGRGEIDVAQTKLDALERLDASYPGSWKLREDVSDRIWERQLPLAYTTRHDHALGGCNGVLTLTSTGFGYRSDEHQWFWGFADVLETDRRDSLRLRIETRRQGGYNFELREALSDDDWARYQQLRSR